MAKELEQNLKAAWEVLLGSCIKRIHVKETEKDT